MAYVMCLLSVYTNNRNVGEKGYINRIGYLHKKLSAKHCLMNCSENKTIRNGKAIEGRE